ncbi:restriction endonuclease FokI C-terminal domain-containing protein [Natroniella sp. ANB-PHB2]|uniref:restriction endonuclease FokI C-terminal domain-containing protein n=1 Tax=Natroniella sp. ANB-PHB2 TaxID=3384444 RepID=UPI0038D4E2A5
MDKKKVLKKAFLSYPPVIRILELLSSGEHLTKFELGKKLGFVGEDGFTNLPQNILIMKLDTTADNSEKNQMRTDWEGSADKYARMICSWLSKLGWVKQERKIVKEKVGSKVYSDYISQSYFITAEGIKVLRSGRGNSRRARITKNIFWEMLCTKGADRDYIRDRRAYIIKALDNNSILSLEEIKSILKEKYKMVEELSIIKDDIEGIINIGLNIEKKSRGYTMYDSIINLYIPKKSSSKVPVKSKIRKRKDKCRSRIKNLSHDYLSLIDLSFNGRQSRLFEMQTVDLLVSECKFKGQHLGGAREPDGIIYTKNLNKNYGIIIDNKAYKNGYNVSHVDEMVRYIEENKTRNEEINSNDWWNFFPEEVEDFYFLFISSYFKGNYFEKLKRIKLRTGVEGGLLTSYDLLLLVDLIKSAKLTLSEFKSLLQNNDELLF